MTRHTIQGHIDALIFGNDLKERVLGYPVCGGKGWEGGRRDDNDNSDHWKGFPPALSPSHTNSITLEGAEAPAGQRTCTRSPGHWVAKPGHQRRTHCVRAYCRKLLPVGVAASTACRLGSFYSLLCRTNDKGDGRGEGLPPQL